MEAAKGSHQRGKSQTLAFAAQNNTIDFKGYRGNLYKQTLSPSWSKSKLIEAQNKYNSVAEDNRGSMDYSGLSNGPTKRVPVDASKRDSFFDTRISGAN